MSKDYFAWKNIQLSKVREVVINSRDPLNPLVKYDYNELSQPCWSAKTSIQVADIKNYEPSRAYFDVLKITKEKLKHLEYILNNLVTDDTVRKFYTKIIENQQRIHNNKIVNKNKKQEKNKKIWFNVKFIEIFDCNKIWAIGILVECTKVYTRVKLKFKIFIF